LIQLRPRQTVPIPALLYGTHADATKSTPNDIWGLRKFPTVGWTHATSGKHDVRIPLGWFLIWECELLFQRHALLCVNGIFSWIFPLFWWFLKGLLRGMFPNCALSGIPHACALRHAWRGLPQPRTRFRPYYWSCFTRPSRRRRPRFLIPVYPLQSSQKLGNDRAKLATRPMERMFRRSVARQDIPSRKRNRIFQLKHHSTYSLFPSIHLYNRIIHSWNSASKVSRSSPLKISSIADKNSSSSSGSSNELPWSILFR
jgi:hypothetical protein